MAAITRGSSVRCPVCALTSSWMLSISRTMCWRSVAKRSCACDNNAPDASSTPTINGVQLVRGTDEPKTSAVSQRLDMRPPPQLDRMIAVAEAGVLGEQYASLKLRSSADVPHPRSDRLRAVQECHLLDRR